MSMNMNFDLGAVIANGAMVGSFSGKDNSVLFSNSSLTLDKLYEMLRSQTVGS